MTLTKAQRLTLQHAARIADDGEYDGVSPTRGGQHKMYAHLESLGLLKYDGPGEDDESRPVSIYKITDAGHRLLEELVSP